MRTPHRTLRLSGAALGSAALAATLLGGCSSAHPTSSPAESNRSRPSSTPSVQAFAGTVPLPDKQFSPKAKDLLAVQGASGTREAGQVTAAPGTLWVGVNCTGDGDMVLTFSPLDSFTLTCGKGLSPSLNQINLIHSRALDFRVQASDSIRWSLRVYE